MLFSLFYLFVCFFLDSLLGKSGLGLYSPILKDDLTVQVEKPYSSGLLDTPLMQ